jgi:hypothetical protein
MTWRVLTITTDRLSQVGSPAAIHTFANSEQAVAFRDDHRLRERLHNIGVIGLPRIELYVEQE